jgi:hypothetical protein
MKKLLTTLFLMMAAPIAFPEEAQAHESCEMMTSWVEPMRDVRGVWHPGFWQSQRVCTPVRVVYRPPVVSVRVPVVSVRVGSPYSRHYHHSRSSIRSPSHRHVHRHR